MRLGIGYLFSILRIYVPRLRQSAKYWHRQMYGIVCKFSCNVCVCVQYALHFLFLTYGKYLFCQCPLLESLDAPFADISSANEYKYR